MTTILQQRLLALRQDNAGELLSGGLRGLEKESLRVASTGGIAQTPHPEILGSALTHSWITTDFITLDQNSVLPIGNTNVIRHI